MYRNTESALTTESLDGYLPNLVRIKYSLTPNICIDFGPNPPGVESRAGPLYRSYEGPCLQRTSSLELDLGYSNKGECIAMI